jgi:hypothetical protein
LQSYIGPFLEVETHISTTGADGLLIGVWNADAKELHVATFFRWLIFVETLCDP